MLATGIVDRPIYRWWVFAAVALGTITSVINHGSMSVALPTIAQHFGADLATAQWVVIAEGLAISALILPMGRLSDIVGRKRVYFTGLVVFAGAALMAAGSQSIIALIGFKAVQGLGAAMTQGTGMAMVTSVFPAEERGKGIGSHASVVGTGGVLGPVIGGFLITAFDWRWVFYVNVLMGICAMAAVLLLIRSDAFRQDSRDQRYDFPGAALSTAVLLTFLLAVSNGSRMGWTSAPIVAAALGFVGFLSAFILVGTTLAISDAGHGTVQEQGLQHRHLHEFHVFSGHNISTFPAALLLAGGAWVHSRAGRTRAASQRGQQNRYGSVKWTPIGPVRLEAIQHRWPASVGGRSVRAGDPDGVVLRDPNTCGNPSPEFGFRPLPVPKFSLNIQRRRLA